jgi:hypothetical protein
MTGCKNCDSNCFQIIFDTCVGYTGDGVPSGSNIKDVITYLLSEIAELKQKLAGCDRCKDQETPKTIPGFTSTYSPCAGRISATNLQYTVTPGTEKINVGYNLSSILDSLPSDIKPIKTDIRLYSGNSLVVNSDKDISSFSLAPNKFPARMDCSVMLGTPCGSIVLENTVHLNGGLNGAYTANLNVKDYSSQEAGELTQEQFAEEVKNKVVSLERETTTTKFPNVVGTDRVYLKQGASIDDILQKLVHEVDTLKK